MVQEPYLEQLPLSRLFSGLLLLALLAISHPSCPILGKLFVHPLPSYQWEQELKQRAQLALAWAVLVPHQPFTCIFGSSVASSGSPVPLLLNLRLLTIVEALRRLVSNSATL